MLIDRTRFLDTIDRMVMRDKRGAIADMLQVLRELGVVKGVNASVHLNSRYEGQEGYRDSIKRTVVDHIGSFLLNEGELIFSERDRDPMGCYLVGTVEVVRNDP